jgi:hypothetical protein
MDAMNARRIRSGWWASLLVVVCVQSAATEQAGSTLYSPNKYRNEGRDSCLDLKTGATAPRTANARCDVLYGNLYAGADLDWFQGSSDRGSRSVIRDLGLLAWSQPFQVPVVPPLPKLLPGQQRTVTIDTSGADGADGTPGTRGKPGSPGADADGIVRPAIPSPPPPSALPPAQNKHDGTPKIDPAFVKAVAGHVYVIHVVDDENDFYALFRVETIERGDRCVVSWKLIEPPRGR